jgi:hypothetical protein
MEWSGSSGRSDVHQRGAFVLAAAAILVAVPARASDAGDEAKGSYQIITSESTPSLSRGRAGKLILTIAPTTAHVHVNAQAPLHIQLEASPGLKLTKERLGHSDAVKVGSPAPRFEVAFQGVSEGRQEARARLEFFVCSDSWCVRQLRLVTIPVEVR